MAGSLNQGPDNAIAPYITGVTGQRKKILTRQTQGKSGHWLHRTILMVVLPPPYLCVGFLTLMMEP
jgi:hypothetical protein